MASATSSVKPKLSTVSIMPGMEMAAPERTDSKSGAEESPSFAPAKHETPTHNKAAQAREWSASEAVNSKKS